MTEIEIINRATASAGIRAPVYYFHSGGFIEEFLSGKVNLWKSQEDKSLTVRDRAVWSNVARLIAEMHSLELDTIDKAKYTRPSEGWWNTRLIREHFIDLLWSLNDGMFDRTMKGFLTQMGITRDQLFAEIDWVNDRVRSYYDDSETPVLCHNDPHLGKDVEL